MTENMTPEQRLKEVIALTGEYYKSPVSKELLLMYFQDLCDLDTELVIQAYQNYRRNPRNKTAPLPSMIRDILCPGIDSDTLAISTASKVTEAVSKFGWNNFLDAREYIGELGWAAAKRFGDWTYVCENLGTSKIPLTTFQAQIREIAKAEGRIARAGGSPALGYEEKNRLIQEPANVLNLLTIKEVKNV